jgi:hypothetical protein
MTDLLTTRFGLFTAWLVSALAAAAVLAVLVPGPGVVRAGAVLTFAFVAPGAAIAGLLGTRTAAAWAAVTLGGSLTVGLLGSEAAALAGWWQPRVLLVVLAVLSTAAALLAARVDARRAGTEAVV